MAITKNSITYLVNAEDNRSEEEQRSSKKGKHTSEEWVTLLSLPSHVLFPHMTSPIKLTKKKDIQLVEMKARKKELIGIIAPKEHSTQQDPAQKLHSIGTLAKILKIIHLSKEEIVVVLQGQERFQLEEVQQKLSHPVARIKALSDDPLSIKSKKTTVLLQSIKETALELLSNLGEVPNEVHMMIENAQNPDFLIFYIASNLISFPQTQYILELESGLKRATLLLKYMLKDLEYLKIQKQIHRKVHSDLNQKQREFYLKQQIKVLQEELGQNIAEDDEIEELYQKSQSLKWPLAVQNHFEKTLRKAARMHPGSSEYSNLISYANTFSEMPWAPEKVSIGQLKRAERILDKAHYGMQSVKERILEFLATQKLRKKPQGRILCLLGPPGVGKTSLCQSIAEALGRKYVRIALGGVYDEAQLRGHRKTYVGAMMGDIMNAIRKTGSQTPLILLDEIDKIDNRRGNPAGVLLDILDPVQNNAFQDNYLGYPFDLSKVLFIATANDISHIHSALVDRMQVIRLNGYPTEEKMIIAQQHLIPKARKKSGLPAQKFSMTTQAIETLIEKYTRESGVRELSQKLDTLASKIAKAVVFHQPYPKRITEKKLPKLLGHDTYEKEQYKENVAPGVSIGLAWTPTGGEILFIEALLYPGSGELITSGQLGDVMDESASTALSYLKANAHELNIPEKAFKKYDLHIHIPDGATPKDGPSAGIALFIALASLYTQRKIKSNIAMTGEITLQGNILAVGGIQEKVLAAQRAKIKKIILSEKNKKDVARINPKYIQNLSFHYTSNAHEVLELALEKEPVKKPTWHS